MPSRLKMEAAHFRVTGMAQLQIGVNICPHKAMSRSARET